MDGTEMRFLHALLIAVLINGPAVLAQSTLLESVKRNPEEALALCKEFRYLNSRGVSANSKQALKKISQQRNLSIIDAEILSMYVIGLNCPDVR